MLPSQHYRQPEAGAVLTALHDITARLGYLPADEVRKVAQELGIPLAQMFSAATFYAAFTFKPCPVCGQPFAPEPMAFLRDLAEVSEHLWSICPACRRKQAAAHYDVVRQAGSPTAQT